MFDYCGGRCPPAKPWQSANEQFLAAVPKNRTDLLPHYSRFIAILDRYMPDVGTGVIELVS